MRSVKGTEYVCGGYYEIACIAVRSAFSRERCARRGCAVLAIGPDGPSDVADCGLGA